MVLTRRELLAKAGLAAGAALSALVFAQSPHAEFHPLAVMASLLPLQLAALLWVRR
jgi:uncharacterized membrane protein